MALIVLSKIWRPRRRIHASNASDIDEGNQVKKDKLVTVSGRIKEANVRYSRGSP